MLRSGSTFGGALICPSCQSDSCRRSKRRGIWDYIVGVTGLRPWRCRACEARFYAWVVPISYAAFVHCPQCGNLDVQRISREHVSGGFAWLKRLLHFPAYRCDPCRHRFFSLRQHRRILPVHSESTSS